MKKFAIAAAIAAAIATATAAQAAEQASPSAAARAAAEAKCLQTHGFVPGRDFKLAKLIRRVAGRPVPYGAKVVMSNPMLRAVRADPVLRRVAMKCRQPGAQASRR